MTIFWTCLIIDEYPEMEYDLTTDGELNDLTIQIEFLKHGTDYLVSLEDMYTL